MAAELRSAASGNVPTTRAKALALGRFRVPLAIVVVTLFPIALTAPSSAERHFAWLFSCAVSAVLVVLRLSELLHPKQPGHCSQCAYDLL
jgi:ABC-type multidrug transport system permease subunit